MTTPMDDDRMLLAYFEGRSTTHEPEGLLETVLAGVERTHQRPAWQTVDWWLSSASADRVTWHARRFAIVAAVGLLIALLLALALLGGTGNRLPPPLGLARPGAIVMDVGGDIYLAGPDGGNPTKLYAGPHWDGHATFSPDGTKIAFESTLDDMSKALMVMRSDGTGRTTLMSGLAAVDEVIAWSPDSRRIAIGARPVDEPGGALFPLGDSRILVADVEQGRASFLSGVFGQDPRWSPDGTMLAFGRIAAQWGVNPLESPGGVSLVRPDGSGLRRLSSVAAGVPAWSPDGKTIAFLGVGVGGGPDLYLIGADGTDERNVTNDPESESYPVWSPDGSKMAFPRMLDSYNKGELTILDITEGKVTALEGANVTFDPPVWRPDGTHVLAYLYRGGQNIFALVGYDDLVIFDVTNGSRPITIPITGVRYASWQRLAP
jgi:TolB protein